jgi:L-alanine-DL-glutamate epimerase-like enolase superfamily enzyme
MKISRIDLYTTALPYSGGVYRLSAGRTYESFDASIIRITCDDGTEGWGRAHRSGRPTSPPTRSGHAPASPSWRRPCWDGTPVRRTGSLT